MVRTGLNLFPKPPLGMISKGLRIGRTVRYLLGSIRGKQENDSKVREHNFAVPRNIYNLYIDIPEEKIKS